MLLDTHAFIWWDAQPAKLSLPALRELRDPTNFIYPSAVSIWEMCIKQQLGKLTLHGDLPTIIAQQQANGILILNVNLQHSLAMQTLPPIHKDPFDRQLIAQASVEHATIITADATFGNYAIPITW